ncbi:MAG TPA: Glu/Leu/Phe/Val dehydrogenase dimerization domain-containing protein [Thermodesulfobacteriota bacterium]|nr:Glu/Leu/Phe/Val dehydrogenase dimerization domain-containing protein [Thermodesulfobacteriota bacterium]
MENIHESLPGGHTLQICMEKNDKTCVGGTRVRKYQSTDGAFYDCKRLCEGMVYKSAWAQLPWYGAKAVIDADPSDLTKDDWNAYAKVLNRLGGSFITATDMGTSIKNMEYLKTMTPYVSAADTAHATAYVAVECVKAVAESRNIPIGSVLIQGMGKIGSLVGEMLHKIKASRIFICDIDESRCECFRKLDPKLFHVVSPDHTNMKVDYFIPCSVGTIITRNNVSDIKASVICGAANNQLESDDLAELLHERGILYVPDFIANSGGLLKVAIDEGVTSPDSLGLVSKKLEPLLFKSRSFGKPLLSLAKDQCRKRVHV